METVVIFLLFFGIAWGLDVVTIILSQPNDHHLRLADTLKNDIRKQADGLQLQKAIIHLSHEDFPHVGHWTVLPILPQLRQIHGGNASWFLFLEDRTRVKLERLLEILANYNDEEPVWLGHAVHDNEATIIHHFAFYNDPKQFKFPNLASGIAINNALLQSLANRLEQQSAPNSDFSIDPAHELALFVWNKGTGEALTHDEKFCLTEEQNCATFPIPFQQCGDAVPRNSIYFAVKTCEKFHTDRVLVVQKTWGRYTPNIEFFSDVKDSSIPTVNLGIPNTEQGHCAKTISILKYLREKITGRPEIKWVVIADDDTIVGVSRMQRLLSCYNSTKAIALGERYGYNVLSPRGYNYITGGGGMVFSRMLLKQLTSPGTCECPSINTPDDMFLGLCIANLGMSVTHSPLFHQARSIDYPPEYLSTKDALSFHKHWMIDPVDVYAKWFAEEDALIGAHEEL